MYSIFIKYKTYNYILKLMEQSIKKIHEDDEMFLSRIMRKNNIQIEKQRKRPEPRPEASYM